MYRMLSASASFRRASVWLAVLLGGSCAAHSQTLPASSSRVPQRVMSLSLCTDALLLDLLPPERITSVTYLSHESTDPALAAEAARVGVNYGSAEEVLAENPDLVLAGTYSTPETRALLTRLGTPMLVVPPDNDFAAIRATVRNVARAVGAERRAELLLAHMDATLAALARNRPPRRIRVAAWGGDGYVPGRDTLFAALLAAAGGVNIAAPPGDRSGFFDIEQLLMARPDVLAYASDEPAPALVTETADHPVLLRLYVHRRITYRGLFADCGLPESVDAAVALQRQLLAVIGTIDRAPPSRIEPSRPPVAPLQSGTAP